MGTKDETGVQKTNPAKCKTCIFREGQTTIRPERLVKIQGYLATGQNHQCHATPLLCRGGREYQAMIFNRLGSIPEATVEDLEDRIRATLKLPRKPTR